MAAEPHQGPAEGSQLLALMRDHHSNAVLQQPHLSIFFPALLWQASSYGLKPNKMAAARAGRVAAGWPILFRGAPLPFSHSIPCHYLLPPFYSVSVQLSAAFLKIPVPKVKSRSLYFPDPHFKGKFAAA